MANRSPTISPHLPRGERLRVTLALAKRPEGVTSLEALHGGAGSRLAANILKLKRKGHTFRDAWEVTPKGSRVKRYWRTGFAPVEGGDDAS